MGEFCPDADQQPMSTAPRNGLSIIVGSDDVGEIIMHWEPAAENGLFPGRLGFWVALDRSMTWSEHDGAGPDYWRAIQSAQPTSPSEASAGNSGLDEPLPPALPYSAASRP